MSDLWMKRLKLERAEGWQETNRDVPYIEFDDGWEVKVMMPTMGAMARFMVKSGDADASVFLDTMGRLGSCCDENGNECAYWEVYPVGNDIGRVAMDDVEGLLELIRESIDEQTNANE